MGGIMSLLACRMDRHTYEAVEGSVAGVGRRTCTACGAVQIDLRSEGRHRGSTSVFAPRRPTLFSIRPEEEADDSVADTAGFGVRMRRRS